MVDLVPAGEIEKIFDVPRPVQSHLGLLKDGTVYIMHSQECLFLNPDLRECEFSRSLDTGVSGHWHAGTVYQLFIRADKRLGTTVWGGM